MTAIGTICHSDHDPAEGIRVTLYRVDGSDCVWAAAEGEEPYRTDVPLGRELQAWHGPQWDYQPLAAATK